MASLPPTRQASQPRRSSPEQTANTTSQSRSSPSPVRTRSEDSQTLFLNKPEIDAAIRGAEAAADQQQEQTQPQSASGNEEEPNVQKCWICFSDSSEDTPETSPWRSPCPCALVAHEECLLDWIADMEAPNNRRHNHSLTAPKIECPQCKTEIKLARPRNLVVEAVRGVERLGGQLVTPGAVTVLIGTVYQSSMVWGIHSIWSVFGTEDGDRILRPLFQNMVQPPMEFHTRRELVSKLLATSLNRLAHWRLYVGIPLITPVLVLARTSFADSILPVLPILFFATQTHSARDPIDFGAWPPSASLAFSLLPYLRSAYNLYYQKVWAPKEKQWLKEIQPRVTQDAANGGGADQAGDNGLGPRAGDDNVFEVRIDGWDDWEDDTDNEDAAIAEQAVNEAVNEAIAQADLPPPQEQPQEELGHHVIQPGREPPQQQEPQPEANQQNPQQAQQAQPAQPAHPPAERRLSFSPTAIAETVLGALLFPTVAGMSGELLKFWLPRSWTTPVRPSRFQPTVAKGFLQTKWGRSLVGGCLFVVMKDAVLLYVRWKMAQMHRRRRVVEWKDRKEKARA